MEKIFWIRKNYELVKNYETVKNNELAKILWSRKNYEPSNNYDLVINIQSRNFIPQWKENYFEKNQNSLEFCKKFYIIKLRV